MSEVDGNTMQNGKPQAVRAGGPWRSNKASCLTVNFYWATTQQPGKQLKAFRNEDKSGRLDLTHLGASDDQCV